MRLRTRTRCALTLLAVCMTWLATAADGQVTRPQCNAQLTPADAVFCDGYYALCIKALCKTPAKGTFVTECHCDVVQGWSMGPAACTVAGRSQTTPPAPGGAIMSTYSNYYNTSEKTLTCGDSTRWAWCYGAPCKVGTDGKTATCLCPICASAASTLGGNCKRSNCDQIWSAATPKNDVIANELYYHYLTNKGISVPGPATYCAGSAAPAH